MISSTSTAFQTTPPAMWATQLLILANPALPNTVSAFSAHLRRSPRSPIIEELRVPSTIRRPNCALSNNKRHSDDGTDSNFQQDLPYTNNSNIKIDVPTTLFTIIGTSSSIGTLWSEYAVFLTGCGPSSLPDSIERGCYLGVMVLAGSSLFTRIITYGSSDLSTFVCSIIFNATKSNYGNDEGEKDLSEIIALWLWTIMEWSSLLAVFGAFVTLAAQTFRGEQMDGMSGINVEMCRALRDVDEF